MRAIIQRRYGGPKVLRLEDVEPPVPAANRILVRVRAASINAYDWHMLRGKPILARVGEGWRAPRQPIRGLDVAGVVEAVGAEVAGFAPGDEVYGTGNGTLAEFTTSSERGLVRKPAGVPFEAAAAVSVAARTAMEGLRTRGGLVAGQRVLIDGAGGGVGTFAVQVAKALGADVTAVTSRDKLDLVGGLGADRVLEHRAADLRDGGPAYDLVFDAGGFRSDRELAAATAPGGTVVVCGAGPNAAGWIGPLVGFAVRRIRPRIGPVRVVGYFAGLDRGDVEDIDRMLASGQIRPAVDRVYPLEESAAAMAHVEEGRARGKVVVAI